MQTTFTRPLQEFDHDSLVEIMAELPLWVKHPDYERVSTTYSTFLVSYSPEGSNICGLTIQVDWMNDILSDMWPYLDKVIHVYNFILLLLFFLIYLFYFFGGVVVV